MADDWVRGVALSPNDQGFFGGVQMTQLPDQSTLLRSWWNFSCYYVNNGPTLYPPGSSILRVGLIVADPGLDVLNMPTPITNLDQDWLAITTINPHIAQVDLAGTEPTWMIHWGLLTDASAKSQRRNQTGEDKAVYLTWEFQRGDTPETFRINRWNASWDLYVRTPS